MRSYPGKSTAKIYDFCVMGNVLDIEDEKSHTGKSSDTLYMKELNRILEYSDVATNRDYVLKIVNDMRGK